ncbi:MAG: ferrochelatase [Fibrobacteraceae bacterium]|nr:ferrochelatase [Fibrobacteraceae bacterium]
MPDSILLVQLGSPKSAEPCDVKKYLIDFLGDPHTLGSPPFFWNPLLKYVIAPVRSKASAAKYRKMLESSRMSEMPLIAHTRAFAAGVGELLTHRMHVAFAFEYGSSPSIGEALDLLVSQGAKKIRVISLYPQRSDVTTGAAEALVREAAKKRPGLELEFMQGFSRKKVWINAIADSIRRFWNGKDKILLSFHGVQQKRIDAGDPYFLDVQESANAIGEIIGVKPIVSFQSRFGFVKWLEPSTEDVLKKMGHDRGSVLIACPAFTVDNLETLYEVDVELKGKFFSWGGTSFVRIPCLNADPLWIRSFAEEIAAEENIEV